MKWVAVLCCCAGVVGQETVRLEGLVLDPLSQPVPNAEVIAEIGGEPVAKGRSDASGLFLLARVPAGNVVVRASSAVPDVGAIACDLADPATRFVVVRTGPARRVHGVVHDADGRALANAWVGCTPVGAPWAVAASHTTTDANGHYELSHVPYGDCALRMWVDGHAGIARDIGGTTDVAADCAPPDEEPVRRSFEFRRGTAAQIAQTHVEFLASWHGTPLLLPPALRSPAPDAHGVWCLLGWARGDRITARVHNDLATLDPYQLMIESDLPDRTKFFDAVDDNERAYVQGTLTSPARLPVGDVAFVVIAGAEKFQVRTAADGSFRFRSPVARGEAMYLRAADRRFVLRASIAPGWRLLAPEPVVGLAVQHGAHEPLAIELHAAAAVRARFVDAAGAPVVGAEVRLLDAERHQVEGGAVGGVNMQFTWADVLASTHTGRDGAFELCGVDPATQQFVVQVVGPEVAGLLTCRLEAGRADLGVVEVGASARIEGIASAPDGSALAGARLCIENLVGSQRRLFVTCDRAGRFVVRDLLVGPCRVGIVGQPSTQVVVPLQSGATAKVTLGK